MKDNNNLELTSFSGFDETQKSKIRLSDVFKEYLARFGTVVFYCERPVYNIALDSFLSDKGSQIDVLDYINYNEFLLKGYYSSKENNEEAVQFLTDCFNFFEQPTFVFLNNYNDLTECQKLLESRQADWTQLCSRFKCLITFKSAEDDVLWCGKYIS